MDHLDLLAQMSVILQSPSSSEGHEAPLEVIDPKEKRKRQNRAAQRKYRRKIAQQVKQTEQFAQQAQLALAEVGKMQNSLSCCPECSHCQDLGIFSNDAAAKTPVLLPMPIFSKPTQISRDRHDLPDSPNTSQTSTVSLASPHGGLCCDAQKFDEINFEPSFLGKNSLTAISDSFTKDFGTASVTTKLSNQVDPTVRDGSAPPTPIWYQGIRTDFLQDMGEIYTNTNSIPSIGHQETTPGSPPHRHQSQSQTEAAMHLAAREGHSLIITILLRSNAYVDSRDEKGRTPLHHCAENGHVEAAKLLLASGADPGAMDCEGTSIILAAVKAGREKMVEILVEILRDR